MNQTFPLQLRLNTPGEIPITMEIIAQAQAWFASLGIDQWQNGYPNAEVIAADVERNNSYLLTLGQTIVATAMISFDGEPTYSRIDGEWVTNDDYAVIHRIAVREEYKGQNIASFIFDQATGMCRERHIPSIRVDTHPQNFPMQRVLQKLGFAYCGVVFVHGGSLRWAFEKRISNF